MAFAATQPQAFTYADYCAWPEEERWELIDGVPYNMAPAPTRTHQQVVVELLRQIANFLRTRKKCRVYVAPFDIRLPRSDEADEQTNTVVQPDILVICQRDREDEKGCRGAPDWIIEVLSPSTATKDHILKRELYARHGVREYWLVHPTDKVLTRYDFRQRSSNAEISAAEGETASVLLPDCVIQWAEVWEDD